MPPAPAVPTDPPAGHTWRSLMEPPFEAACQAARLGETPVGAALYAPDGRLLATAYNQPISLHDPTAHAEILCLRAAAEKLGNYRLTGCVLAVTLEPCLMCVGALLHARVAGVVFGAPDPRAGALVSNMRGSDLAFTNHKVWVKAGVMADECAGLLKRFFLERRKNRD